MSNVSESPNLKNVKVCDSSPSVGNEMGKYKSEKKTYYNSVSPFVLGNKFFINIFSDMVL
jgi:hypothetical protein